MTNSKFVFSTLICLVAARWDCLGQVKDSVWIQTKEGCKVYNPRPQKNETITWTGKCADGYANGGGTLTWFKSGKQNQQYTGHMKRGIPNGNGKYSFAGGAIHEGIYVHGKMEGAGQIVERGKNDSVYYFYTGEFKNDSPDGYGKEIYFYPNGDTSSVYTGHFSNAERQGIGLLKDFNKYTTTLIKGYFNKNALQGEVEIWDYKIPRLLIYYNGTFQNDGRNGRGVEVAGANKYVGDWKDNEKNGNGKLFYDSVLIYEGDWTDDQFNGIGKRFFFDGSYYYGEFKNNQRNGLGIQYWRDGTKYVGEFKKDLLSGSGYIIKENETGISGMWENGSLSSSQEYAIVKKRLREKYKDKPRLKEILPN
jgi:hypothetical protein